MADHTVNQGGGPDPDFATLCAAVAAATAGETIEIQGTWSADDTTAVAWDVAVSVTADASAKQIGRPWKTGDTHYRLRVVAATEHTFTVTANLVITDLDIQSESTVVSAELFRAAGASTGTLVNCMLGFTGNTDQQDVWYTESATSRTWLFEQCFFYDVGRSIFDSVSDGNGAMTINFNSCGSFNIGADGARHNGSWFGKGEAHASGVYAINAHNCLIHVSDTNAFGVDTTDGEMNIDCTYSIANIATTALSANENNEDLTGTVGSYTWTTTPSTGDQVGLTNITSGTYDPALVDDADNDAQEFHATATDAGLTIPLTDILGKTRDTGAPPTNFFDVGPHALTLAAAAFGGQLNNPIFRVKNRGYGHLREIR